MIAGLGKPPGDPSCHGMAGELARLGGQAVPYLLGALDHPHPQVRRRTVKALGGVREHFAFCEDWLAEGEVPAGRLAETEAYRQGVGPHLPAIVQGLLLMHRFEPDAAIRWWTERALGYGKLERISLACYREYLETIRQFQRWDYCSAMADGLLSKNADYEAIARDAWRESATGLKAQCLQDMVPEEVAENRELVAQRFGSLGLSPAQVTLLLAANGEQVEEVSARIVRELEGLPPGAKLEEAPFTIIRAVPGSESAARKPTAGLSKIILWSGIAGLILSSLWVGHQGIELAVAIHDASAKREKGPLRFRPFPRWARGSAAAVIVLVALAMLGLCTVLFRYGMVWTGEALKDETSPRVLLGAGACMLALLAGAVVLGAGLLSLWELFMLPDPPSAEQAGERMAIVPLLRERLGRVEVAELRPGRS